MLKRFLKGLLIVIFVALLGFVSGYYSEKFISPDKISVFNKYMENIRGQGQPAAPANSMPENAGEDGVSPGPGPAEVDTAGNPAPAIGEDDLSLGGMKPGDNRQLVEETLGQSIKVLKSVDSEKGQVRTFVSNRLTVEWSKKTGVFAITATSPEVATVRGLQVGDPMAKAYQLYGRPSSDQDGLAAYQYPASGTEVFFIKYADNKVTEIKITYL